MNIFILMLSHLSYLALKARHLYNDRTGPERHVQQDAAVST